jgi:hypothetical protein
MKIEEEIAAQCLFGFISGAPKHEQQRSLKKIEALYGPSIAGIVRRRLDGRRVL